MLLVGAGTFIFYYYWQPALDYSKAPLFDGNQYQKIYDHFRTDSAKVKIPFPYHSRLLVPYLASLMPFQNLIDNFQAINFIFTMLSIFVLYKLWRQVGIPRHLILLGFGWLFYHWTGLIRLNQFDPVNVDVPLYLFQSLLLLVIFSNKYHWLAILGPIATVQKESFIALLAVLLIYHLIFNRKGSILLWVSIGLAFSIIAKLGANKYFGSLHDSSAIETMYKFALETGAQPFKLVRWSLAIFTAFGPIFILFLIKYRNVNFSHSETRLLIVLSLVYGLFGLLAGGDITRILFLGFPFVMTLSLYTIRATSKLILLLVLLLSLPWMRLVSLLPDPVSQPQTFYSWYPEFADVTTVLLWLAYVAVCWGALFWSSSYLKIKTIS